jgi:hypothetical protein
MCTSIVLFSAKRLVGPRTSSRPAGTKVRPKQNSMAGAKQWIANSVIENDANAFGRVNGGWAYEMKLRRQNGCWIVTELRVFPESSELDLERPPDRALSNIAVGTPEEADAPMRHRSNLFIPSGGLTARHLRQIPFRHGEGVAFLREMDGYCVRIAKAIRTRAQGERKFNRGYSRLENRYRQLLHLAEIAQLYVGELERGSRKQHAEIAARLDLNVSQVRDAIHRARKENLLSSTRTQGTAGGELTPLALELLAHRSNVKGGIEAYIRAYEMRGKKRDED